MRDNNPPATHPPASASRLRALLALVACALLWSLGGILIKSISLGPFAVSGGRSLVAVLFFLAMYGRPALPRTPVFGGAVLAYAGTMLLFVTATKMTTAANAIFLQYTAPVFVCLFGRLFFRERLSRLDLLATALVMAGMVLFFSERLTSAAGSRLGDAIAIGAGACFGLQAVCMRRLRVLDASPESVLIWGNLICVGVALPFLFQQVPSATDLLLLVLMGLIQVGLAYILYNYALRHVSSLELILIPILEPLLNPVWVFLIQGERPGITAIAGGVLILLVVTGWCLLRNRTAAVPPPARAGGAPEA